MRLRLLTLNIFEGTLLDDTLSFLRREKPDIVCLQEVFNGTASSLSKQFRSLQELIQLFSGYEYFYSPELLCVTEEGKIDIGNVIFSHFPISKTKTHFFKAKYGEFPQVAAGGDWSNHPCNLQECVINLDGKDMHIFNIHGIWGIDGKDNQDRIMMSAIIVEAIKGKKRTVLAGDTNVQPNTITIQNIEKHLHNVFKNELTTSFNLKHKNLVKSPGYATAVVDMIFVSPDLKVLNKEVSTDDVSDHLPLICELDV